MSTPTAPAVRSRVAVTAAYAAQGLGYAVVVTSLPVFKDRQGIDDVGVSLIVLLVCVTAALGSVTADFLAKWRGSRIALVVGLCLEVAALLLIVVSVVVPGLPLWVFILAFGIYGLGLGGVDAGGAMQGVLVQRRYGRDIMGGYFAAYTAAAIVGALAVAGSSAAGVAVLLPLSLAALVALVVAVLGLRAFDPARAATPVGGHSRQPLPRRGIWLFGFVILAAFTVDSAVSTWSTVYLQDELLTAAALAPLGYAAYQAAILVTRLVTDRASGRFGRARVVVVATATSLLGCVVVALLPFPAAAIAGLRPGRRRGGSPRAARVHLRRRPRTRAQRRDHRARQPLQLRRGGARGRAPRAAGRRPRPRHRVPASRRASGSRAVRRAAIPGPGGRRYRPPLRRRRRRCSGIRRSLTCDSEPEERAHDTHARAEAAAADAAREEETLRERWEATQESFRERFDQPIQTATKLTRATMAWFPIRVWRHFLHPQRLPARRRDELPGAVRDLRRDLCRVRDHRPVARRATTTPSTR